jgi:hypothetical protein
MAYHWLTVSAVAIDFAEVNPGPTEQGASRILKMTAPVGKQPPARKVCSEVFDWCFESEEILR